MKRSISSVLALVFAVAVAAGQSPAGNKAPRAGAAPATNSSQSAAPAAPRPSPTPTPPLANPGLAQLPITTTAQYSPTHLDFGTVPEGQSARRTLTVTPPIGGIVIFSVPKDAWFWLAEYRELGPLGGGNKNSPMGPMNTSIQRQLKARNVYQAGQLTGDVQWNVGEGSAIQIDLVFQPKLNTLVPSGPTYTLVQLKGPGPMKAWSVSVRACGVFERKPSVVSDPGTGAPSGPKICQF
ncbi:MAG TPA: hypothetical protein VKL40_10595 [Candidatus Angelobacter sp.]|nr:hypothetical protein [Candidatus Angelobacter sp.]